MRAMVMAAGLGTRLRPLTYEIAKPLVPVANRPVMEHILLLLRRHGFGPVIANLHWFGDAIRDRFGDGSRLGIDLTYSREDELLGTAGGVRNVADFFGDEPFLVMAADALTDIDLSALRAAHEANDGIATLAVKRVSEVSEFGVVITDSAGRVQGFQEKPEPAEALSDLASCMIYVLDREIFDYFPSKPAVDFAREVFPALLENDVPFYVHRIDAYWNDVGSLPEYLRGNLDAVEGTVEVEPAGELLPSSGGDEALERGDPGVGGLVLAAEGCEIGADVRLDGPLVIGAGCAIGAGARIKESVVLPGAEVPPGALVASAIYGRKAALS
ncbi:MAG TPA: nucleotidyltransferase family protein [Solirubrobacterales bacterium]|nr:nucleotidyltransferase family protein [Solirubrobacterales bacterium]